MTSPMAGDDDATAADTEFQIDAQAAIFEQQMRDHGHVVEDDGTAWVRTEFGIQRVPNN